MIPKQELSRLIRFLVTPTLRINQSHDSIIMLSSDWLLIFEINMFEHVSMPYLIDQDKKVQSTIKRSHDRVITLSSDWLLIFEINMFEHVFYALSD